MRKILYCTVFIAVLFAGCTKDNIILERDKFIGQWYGNLVTSIKLNGQEIQYKTIEIIETIDAGNNVDQIVFSKGRTNEMLATIADSTFTIQKQTHYDIFDEKIYETSIVGAGVLSKDNVLTISTKQVTVQDNDTIEWICSERLKIY